MPAWPERDHWTAAGLRARAAAAHLRLPFHRQTWRGLTGNWMGAGIGSSIDFQDHRPYLPGDDPRYIDWQAYARTGHYIMKLYREEVSPRLDVVLDLSASMFLTPAKRDRTLDLILFCVESAARAGAAVRAYGLRGAELRALEPAALAAGPDVTPPAPVAASPDLARVPFRPGSMRIWISDLLFPGDPAAWLPALVAARGRGVLLVPYDAPEDAPAWDGNVEFEDCESGARRIQRVHEPLRRRYAEAYRRHFELWRDGCRRRGLALARVPAAPPLADALREHALPEGAAEPWN